MDHTYNYYVFIDVQLHHCVISLFVDQKKIKILFYIYTRLCVRRIKSPSCPYKNDSIHRVRLLGHLLWFIKIKNATNFPKN